MAILGYGYTPEKIVIEVRGGVVVAVHALHPSTIVEIKDWDHLEENQDQQETEPEFRSRMTEEFHEIH